ncbi:MAG TPA: hypothetical protein VE988_14510 [Gemmataceae bacterium]|nr:hypothetical protein [Gemmataceae bacterium]
MRILILMGGTLTAWLLFLPLAIWKENWIADGHLLHSAVAAVICLVPSIATLLWSDFALGKSPEQQLAAVLGGTGVRMGFVVAVGLAFFFLVDGFQYESFWFWIIGFYLLTLVIESALVVRRNAALEQTPQSPKAV